jgi:hypothetical protein
MACEKYKDGNPEAIMITANPSFNTGPGVFELLGDGLGIAAENPKCLFKGMLKKLSRGRVIIVDGAQLPTHDAIEALRALNDATLVGVAFAGNHDIIEKLRGGGVGEGQIRRRTRNHAQVTSAQITLEDIKRIFGYAGLDGKCLGPLHKIAGQRDSLGTAVDVFTNTILFGTKLKSYSGLTVGQLASMAKELKIFTTPTPPPTAKPKPKEAGA